MINALLGIKKNMTSTYDARGRRVGATVVEIQPNQVTQVKTTQTKDGYNAVQIGIGSKKSVRNPQIGHFKKAGIDQTLRYVKEIRAKEEVTETPGQSIKAWDIFSKGDSVKVTGVSKGKGFQGGVRRYNFAGGPKTHGQSDRHRAPGSIGQTTTPGRVYKGKRMAGHMGMDQVSTLNMEVISIDRKTNLVTIKGAIPGPFGGLVTITKLGRIKGYTPPPEPEPEEEEETAEAHGSPAENQVETAVEQTTETTTEATPEAVEASPSATIDSDASESASNEDEAQQPSEEQSSEEETK